MNGLGVAIPDVSLPDYTSQLNQAFAQADQAAQQHHSTLRNVLGAIGDALLIGNGVQPLYHQQQQQNQLATDMTNYLGDNNAALADAFRVNPTVAAEMFKYMHPASEVPQSVKEFDYYNGLPTDRQAAFEKFLQLTHPGLMAPVTVEPGSTVQQPGASSVPVVKTQSDYDALPPGATYQDTRGNYGVKGGKGGQTAGPSGNFR